MSNNYQAGWRDRRKNYDESLRWAYDVIGQGQGLTARTLCYMRAALEKIEALDVEGHDSDAMAEAGYIARLALRDLE